MTSVDLRAKKKVLPSWTTVKNGTNDVSSELYTYFFSFSLDLNPLFLWKVFAFCTWRWRENNCSDLIQSNQTSYLSYHSVSWSCTFSSSKLSLSSICNFQYYLHIDAGYFCLAKFDRARDSWVVLNTSRQSSVKVAVKSSRCVRLLVFQTKVAAFSDWRKHRAVACIALYLSTSQVSKIWPSSFIIIVSLSAGSSKYGRSNELRLPTWSFVSIKMMVYFWWWWLKE